MLYPPHNHAMGGLQLTFEMVIIMLPSLIAHGSCANVVAQNGCRRRQHRTGGLTLGRTLLSGTLLSGILIMCGLHHKTKQGQHSL